VDYVACLGNAEQIKFPVACILWTRSHCCNEQGRRHENNEYMLAFKHRISFIIIQRS
jgi:hypothetical protein